MSKESLEKRFKDHAVDTTQRGTMAYVRVTANRMATYLDEVVPEGREKALALTKLEEAVFWANAGIARSGGGDGTA